MYPLAVFREDVTVGKLADKPLVNSEVIVTVMTEVKITFPLL